MKKKIESNLKVKEIIILAVVVSFTTSVLASFAAGFLGYRIIRGLKLDGNEQILSEPLTGISQEEAVIEAVKKVSPSVVSIIITKDLPVIEEYYQEYNPFGNDDFFRQFFGDDFFSPFRVPQYRQKGTEKIEVGGGTGFVVSASPEGCLILTNKHVVSDEEADYTVLTNEGERIPAKVLALDPVHDIAVLKIDKGGLPAVELGNSDNLRIGQTTIAIGNALGEFRNTVSVGIISGLQRSVIASSGFGQSEQLAEVIQTDAAINQGNSGGPLLNLKGEVIGINVAVAQGAENIGFSLPINNAKRDVEQVEEIGRIIYPFLGVRYILITSEVQEKNNLSVDYGALIVRGEEANDPAITPGSSADKAGLAENDIILEINGERITQDNSLAKMIQEFQPGERIELKVLHQGKEKVIEVELGERE